MVCYNPMMAQQRAGKREELLAATERELEQVARRVQAGAAGGRGGLVGEARIGERVGRGVNKYKMAKHFTWTISDQAFSYARNQDSITQEAALDGSMCCAPTSQRSNWTPPGWFWPTRV